MAQKRVEREWVPLKQYLPTQLYAQLLELIQSDPVYKTMHLIGNEQHMNGIIRTAVTDWLRYRVEIENLNGTTAYRAEEARYQQGYQAYMESLSNPNKPDQTSTDHGKRGA